MKENKVMWKTVTDYALMLNERAERMVGSLEKLVAETEFQEQQVCIAAIKSVLYGYQRKVKYGQPSQFQLIYIVVPMMFGDKTFSMAGLPASLLSLELELVSASSYRATKSNSENRQLRSRLWQTERRFKGEDEVLVVKGKILITVKPNAFQSWWYRPCRVV